jgi:ribose transport system substrate-binding protein
LDVSTNRSHMKSNTPKIASGRRAVMLVSVLAVTASTVLLGGAAAEASTRDSSLATAAALVKKYEEAPSSIPQTVPLEHTVTKGRTFVSLECDNTQCADVNAGVHAAAAAIGWKVVTIDYQTANPATLVTAFQQALQYHPVAVDEIGTGYSQWKSVIPAYKKAKVPIIAANSGPMPLKFPITTVVASPAYTIPASVIAAWFITASRGTGQALIINVPSFPVLAETANSVASTIRKDCSECKSTVLAASLTEIGSGGLVPAIVAALKRDPGIKYVISTNGDFIDGLAPAIQSAGLSGIQIGSTGGGIVNEQDILAGKESATLPWPGGIEGWGIIDAVARDSEGMTVPDGDSNLPIQLLVKSNVGTPTESLVEPANYEKQYEKLWKVSGS